MSSEPRMQTGRPWAAQEALDRGSAAAPEAHLTSEQGRFLQPWINEVRGRVKNSHPRFHPTKRPTIFRAPANMRQADRAAYDPSVVSIGPHYGGALKLENCKWRFVRCLLSRSGNGNNAGRILDECLMELIARDAEVRGCYSDSESLVNPFDLATIMLHDGCFIIYLMLRRQEEGATVGDVGTKKVDKAQESRTKGKETAEGTGVGAQDLVYESGFGLGSESVVDLEIGGTENFGGSLLGHLWTWNLIVYDLLKMENQIPFFVIRLIFDKLFKPPIGYPPGNADQLMDLALNLFSDIHPNQSVRFRTTRPNEIHHLLHLFHSSIVTHRQVSRPAVAAAMYEASTTPKRIPNATDLAMAGVKLKRKEKFDSFLDVSFENGILEIPPLQIFDYSKSLFRNLIAFEQCYPDTNTDITIYANFMDCIIDTANDARLLYLKGILFNGLGTNDEVASLFNQLCNQIHFDPTKNYLNDLFVEVTKYHGSKWHQWRAGLARDYFSSPWAIISLFAAVLLLLLTIEQCFFAAFSYFRPP